MHQKKKLSFKVVAGCVIIENIPDICSKLWNVYVLYNALQLMAIGWGPPLNLGLQPRDSEMWSICI